MPTSTGKSADLQADTPAPGTASMAGTKQSEAVVRGDIRYRVGRAWREMRRGAAAIAVKDYFYGSEEHGELDLALADALAVIAQQGPIRMGELAEALHITPASTTRAVRCLVEKGFVGRETVEEDHRSVQVRVTPAGQARFNEMSTRIQQGMTLVLSEFSAEEQEQLAGHLDRFVTAVERLATTAKQAPRCETTATD